MDDQVWELKRIARDTMPINYQVGPSSHPGLFYLLAKAFPQESEQHKLIESTRNAPHRGIIVFGYNSSVSLQPMFDEFDKIPIIYGRIRLDDGREIGFIGHHDARTKLYVPVGTSDDGVRNHSGCFDGDLTKALTRQIDLTQLTTYEEQVAGNEDIRAGVRVVTNNGR